MSKKRLLVIAEACNPTWTSVPLVGYQAARALARRPDLEVTIATHIRNKAGLLNDELHRLAHVVFIDSDALAGPLYRLGRKLRGGQSLGWTTSTALAWPGYVLFERKVRDRFRTELDCGYFHLVHRLTPVSPVLVSALPSLTDTPMLIGPLNGGLPWPKEFPELKSAEREWFSWARSAYRMMPYYRTMFARAAGVIAGSHHAAQQFPRNPSTCKYFYQPENGIDPGRFPLADGWRESNGRFRFITVGRLVPLKGNDLTLEAMAQSPVLRQAELTIIGDGPERQRLQDQAASLGIADRVRFTGWLDQEAVAAELRSSQAFVFPSLREFGGGVVLEAMASALPSIVVNYGGPAELVDETCGYRLPMGNRPQMVSQLRDAMEHLTNSSSTCRDMGRSAVALVRNRFTWDAKAAQLNQIYNTICGSAV